MMWVRPSALLLRRAVPRRGLAGRAFEFPAAALESSVEAKIPMYVGDGAKDHYVGEADLDFVPTMANYWKFLTSGTVMDMAMMYFYSREERTMPMYDARALEAAEGLSKRDFFQKHGFVLLDHPSAMEAEDWRASAYEPLKAHDPSVGTAHPLFTQGETPVKQKYNVEVEALLKTLVPTATEFASPVRGIQRGPGSPYEKMYASVVHTDFPLEYETFRETNRWLGCSELLDTFEKTDAASYFILNLWRPVKPMKGTVKSTPLAMIHPGTMAHEDFVKVDLLGGQFPEGQNYLHVRHNPEHKWFYYSDMGVDEVLVWKQAHFVKGEKGGRMAIPHTAFKHPHAETETEPRCSFEHRVSVFCSTPEGI